MTEEDVLDPETLYTVESEPQDSGSVVLLHAMQGFVDAGSATRLAADDLLAELDHRVVATFDADQLVDYRSRRPGVVYDRDHYSSYREPRRRCLSRMTACRCASSPPGNRMVRA